MYVENSSKLIIEGQKLFCRIILFNLVVIYGTWSSQHKCWKGTTFSTKSPYKVVQPDQRVVPITPAGVCKPVQINMVHRHGNRFPSEKDVRKMVAMSKKLNKAAGKIQPSVKVKLPWHCPFSEEQNKLLSRVGEKELYHIGRNIRTNFPELFTREYSPLFYKFQSTCKLRCTHSSSALGAGLFEHLGSIGECKFQPIAIQTSPCYNDSVLRFFEKCTKYVDEVEEDPSTLLEMRKFEDGPEMHKVLEKLNLKLGTNETGLTTKDLKAMFIACSYDIGMFDGSSGICSLFDTEDITVIEYLLELKHFYKRSAGFKITYESSCPLLRDIVDTLKLAAANDSRSHVGIFRSAHAETLIPLHALLGINMDAQHPTATNFAEMENRRFRAGCISPFSGNINFVLYVCENGGYKIQTYVNERLAKIPCCDSEVDCKFEDFLKCYENIAKTCNFDEMCRVSHTEL